MEVFPLVYGRSLSSRGGKCFLWIITWRVNRSSWQVVMVSDEPVIGELRKCRVDKDLGRRLAVRFQDQRESDFLFQRLSLAILRGNAFSILQSYRD